MTKKEVARYRLLLGYNLAFLPGGASFLPVASSVSIDNTAPQVGDILTGSHVFSDPQGDPEGVSLSRWLIETGVGTGVYTGLPGGNAATYTVVQEDLGRRFIYGVTPVSTVSPFVGIEKKSSPTAAVVAGPFNPNNLFSLRTWAKLRDPSTVTRSGTVPNEYIDLVLDSSLRNTNFWTAGLSGVLKPRYQNNRAVFDGSVMTLVLASTKDIGIAQNDPRTFAIVFAGDSTTPVEFFGLWESVSTYTLHNKTNGIGLRDSGVPATYFHAGDARLFDDDLHVLIIRGSTPDGVKVRLDDDEESNPSNSFSMVLVQP